MVQEDNVREALKEVIDPELGINIIDLGLVYEIEVEEDRVEILMTLTTPGCPFGSIFDEMVRQEVGAVEGVNEVDVELTFEPSWTPEEMTDEARNEIGHLPGMEGF
jgi:metal-sulfur cluster biosynthetic enzyme